MEDRLKSNPEHTTRYLSNTGALNPIFSSLSSVRLEQLAHNEEVTGSNPVGSTKELEGKRDMKNWKIRVENIINRF